MRLVSITITPKLKLGFLFLLGCITVSAQENSPFSRYGLGDTYAGQNVLNRGMAGIAATLSDPQSTNFSNPASYSAHKIVTFDVGVYIENRTLRSLVPPLKYSATNFTPSYFAMSMPLDKKRNLGLTLGLRPIYKISYSVNQASKLTPLDSMGTLYEGNGGLYQLFAGIGKRWGGLSIGFNTGYAFGKKETNTRIYFINDTVPYTKSNSGTLTSYGKFFIDGGLQYELALSKNSSLRFGVTGGLKQTFNAKQDIVRETFQYDVNGASYRIDSVFESKDRKGKIEIPSTYTAGIAFSSFVEDRLKNKAEKFLIGIDYETADWSTFKFYGQPDNLDKFWQLRIGAQLVRDPMSITSYWNRVSYRGGFYFGRDRINLNGKSLPMYGVTFGAGLPVRKWRSYDNQFTVINTALEFGKRGNKDNNINENYFRLSFGLSLSDIWFIKKRYD